MVANIPRHKVFISFHEKDIEYKERFCPHDGEAHSGQIG